MPSIGRIHARFGKWLQHGGTHQKVEHLINAARDDFWYWFLVRITEDICRRTAGKTIQDFCAILRIDPNPRLMLLAKFIDIRGALVGCDQRQAFGKDRCLTPSSIFAFRNQAHAVAVEEKQPCAQQRQDEEIYSKDAGGER